MIVMAAVMSSGLSALPDTESIPQLCRIVLLDALVNVGRQGLAELGPHKSAVK